MEVHGDDSLKLSESEPHCGQHGSFVEGCAVCRRARANFLPYPIRPSEPPLPRSFGFTDNITEKKLRGPAYRNRRLTFDSDSEVEVSLSLTAIRVILRLLWPFGRIGP
jgi:hypothetical protein